MTISKIIWFFSFCIFSSTANILERVIKEFFYDEPKICYISTEGGFSENYGRISENKVGETWILDKTTNSSCSNLNNFIILIDNEFLTKTIKDMQVFIPVSSKILVISKINILSIRELRFALRRNNWDLLIYKEEETAPQGQLFFSPFYSKYFICRTAKTYKCINNSSEITQFIRNRPKLNPKQILRALNRTLTVVTIQNPPYTIVTDDTHYTGIEIEILKILYKHPIRWKVLNKIPLPKIPVSENPWKNISVQLLEMDDGADLALSALWMGKYKYDTTYPSGQQCITFMVKRPVLFSEYSFMFQSLSLKLWTIIAAFLIFIILALTTIQSGYSPTDFSVGYNKGKTVMDVMRTFAGSSMTSNLSGSNNLLRIIILLWLLLCLIMVTCYNAGLTTSLKYPKLTEEIKNLQDMIDRNIHWMDEIDGVYDFISTSNDDVSEALVNLYDNELNKTIRNSRLAKQNYAFRVDNLSGGYVGNIEGIDDSTLELFQILPDCYKNIHVVIGLKPRSPLKKFFDVGMLRATQHGFMDRWFRKFANMKRFEAMQRLFSPNSREREETLNFGKMKGAFFLLLIGLGLGTAVFAYEMRLKFAQ